MMGFLEPGVRPWHKISMPWGLCVAGTSREWNWEDGGPLTLSCLSPNVLSLAHVDKVTRGGQSMSGHKEVYMGGQGEEGLTNPEGAARM